MAEYIERETFLKDIEERYCLPCKEAGRDHNGCKCRACWVDDMRGDVIDAPDADVAPVRHGQWEWDTEDIYMCSNCAEKSHVKEVMGRPAWGCCPNCGAKMDGGDGNDDAE